MFRESSAIDSERTAASVRSLYAKYSADENWFNGSPDSVDRRIAQAKRIANAAKAACVRLSGRNVISQYIALAHEMDSDRAALEGLRRDLLTASSDREAALLDYDDFLPISLPGRPDHAPRHEMDALHNQAGADMDHVDNILRRNDIQPPGYFSRGDGKHRAANEESGRHTEYQEGFGHTIEKTRDPGDYEGRHRSGNFSGLLAPLVEGVGEGIHQELGDHHPDTKFQRFIAPLLEGLGDEWRNHHIEARHFIAEQDCDDLGELMIRAKNYAERVASRLSDDQSRMFVASFVQAVRGEYKPPAQTRTAAKHLTQDFPADFLYLE